MRNLSNFSNSLLAQKIIELHDKGYSEDFYTCENGKLIWSQSGKSMEAPDFITELTEILSDDCSGNLKFIYLVSLHNGVRGMCITSTQLHPAQAGLKYTICSQSTNKMRAIFPSWNLKQQSLRNAS